MNLIRCWEDKDLFKEAVSEVEAIRPTPAGYNLWARAMELLQTAIN